MFVFCFKYIVYIKCSNAFAGWTRRNSWSTNRSFIHLQIQFKQSGCPFIVLSVGVTTGPGKCIDISGAQFL